MCELFSLMTKINYLRYLREYLHNKIQLLNSFSFLFAIFLMPRKRRIPLRAALARQRAKKQVMMSSGANSSSSSSCSSSDESIETEISLYTPSSSEEEDEDEEEDEYQQNEKKEDDSDGEEVEESDDDKDDNDDDDDDDNDCEADYNEREMKEAKVEEEKSEAFLKKLLDTVGIVKHLTSTIGGNMVYIYKKYFILLLIFCSDSLKRMSRPYFSE